MENPDFSLPYGEDAIDFITQEIERLGRKVEIAPEKNTLIVNDKTRILVWVRKNSQEDFVPMPERR